MALSAGRWRVIPRHEEGFRLYIELFGVSRRRRRRDAEAKQAPGREIGAGQQALTEAAASYRPQDEAKVESMMR